MRLSGVGAGYNTIDLVLVLQNRNPCVSSNGERPHRWSTEGPTHHRRHCSLTSVYGVLCTVISSHLQTTLQEAQFRQPYSPATSTDLLYLHHVQQHNTFNRAAM